MREIMIPVLVLCYRHLGGEHGETHMILWSLKHGRKLDGYAKRNCLEIRSLKRRHDALANEMKRRGYKHKTPMRLDIDTLRRYLTRQSNLVISSRVDKIKSFHDIIARCPRCRKRYEAIQAATKS